MHKSKQKHIKKEQKKLLTSLSEELQELFSWYSPQEAEDMLLKIHEWANCSDVMDDTQTRSDCFNFITKLKNVIRASGRVAV